MQESEVEHISGRCERCGKKETVGDNEMRKRGMDEREEKDECVRECIHIAERERVSEGESGQKIGRVCE